VAHISVSALLLAAFLLIKPLLSQQFESRIQGLAPGSYLFFASDVELPLDVHDSAQMDY
jgi:hypothetical protein